MFCFYGHSQAAYVISVRHVQCWLIPSQWKFKNTSSSAQVRASLAAPFQLFVFVFVFVCSLFWLMCFRVAICDYLKRCCCEWLTHFRYLLSIVYYMSMLVCYCENKPWCFMYCCRRCQINSFPVATRWGRHRQRRQKKLVLFIFFSFYFIIWMSDLPPNSLSLWRVLAFGPLPLSCRIRNAQT